MKRLKKIIAILFGLALVLAAAFFALQIRDVKVEGSEIYSEQEIIQSAMSEKYSFHTLYFFIQSHFRQLSNLPFVQEIDIEWQSPFRIVLHVYEKTISGCVKYMGQYVYFDKDGIVLQSLSTTMDGVPVVTGIPFGRFTLNEAFDVDDPTLFDSIMNLSQLITHYKVGVDQIRFNGKEVTLYSGKVQVYLGKKDFYDDDIAALSSVLKKTTKKDLSGTIDMERFESGDKIILRTNNGSGNKTEDKEEESGTEDNEAGGSETDNSKIEDDETNDSETADNGYGAG